jgi:hypothetical protein
MLLLACGVALVMPSSAYAGTGCSTYKSVPGGYGQYSYCSSNDSATNKWREWAILDAGNGGGSSNDRGFTIESQVILRIDGRDHPQPVKSWPMGTAWYQFDPYNGTWGTGLNSCTNGHTYFAILKLRVAGGAWGPLAGSHQFVC